MTNVIDYFREWLKKSTDPPLAQSQRLEKIYSRFMEPSTPAISHVSSLPNVPSHSSLFNDTPPLTWKVINAASRSMQLEAIIADLDSKPWERVSELPPKQAQAVMDELQRILDDSPQIKSVTRTSAIKCLQAIVSLFDGLPASMMIRDVIQDSDKPLCGGSFSDVWLGRVGSQRVALKVLRIYDNDGDEKYMRASKAFRRDALLWRQLRHPGILPVFGVNTTAFSPRPCIVSPYMCNGNVNQFLQRNPTHDRLRMLTEIMDGIDFLHAHDDPIVHGDIRGANILIKDDLTCCISDFGLTKTLLVVDSQIPSSRLAGGAIRWLAPEVLAEGGDQATQVEDMPSRDIYAFGCTTIEICSGKAPFPNIRRDPGVYFAVVVNKMKPPPPPTTFLPQRGWDIASRCLVYDATHRPNAREILEILREICQEEEAWHDSRAIVKDTEISTPAVFALTIGINKYLNSELPHSRFKNLSGCVADADDMDDFLVTTPCLSVPPANIFKLRNEEATAAGITAALRDLETNPSIMKNDVIIIFYAGHGTLAPPPRTWAFHDQIQMLVPYDFDPGSGPNPVARNGLPDFKISQLLERIADAKGNNITVIFDSCHSGSGTRGRADSDVRAARGFDLPPGTMLGEEAFPVSRGGRVPAKSRNMALASHVLLAACTETEHAIEYGGRGAFTSTLLTFLRSEDLQQLTYSDIICRLPVLTNQRPQCEGKYQHRIFLQGATPRRRFIYMVTQTNTDKYVISAGKAHGITIDAEFTVYATKTCTNELGCLVINRSLSYQSFLRPALEPFILPNTIGYAILTCIGITHDVPLFVDPKSDLAGMFSSWRGNIPVEYACKPSFQVVAADDKNPHLIVTANEGRVSFEITDKICRDAGLLKIPHTSLLDGETMTRVLRGVTDFYWNLNRTPGGTRVIFGNVIQFECHELSEALDDSSSSEVMKCTGSNLVVDGMIQIHISDSDEERAYGFSIKNSSNLPLFVSMFYFNMSDLSIESYYQPPSASDKGHIPTLPPGGILTIGYGAGGCEPRTFDLEDSQYIDVGYLKLFLSTKYVDHSMITQRTPFDPSPPDHFISTEHFHHTMVPRSSPIHSPSDDKKKFTKLSEKRNSIGKEFWDVMQIPIVMRREA